MFRYLLWGLLLTLGMGMGGCREAPPPANSRPAPATPASPTPTQAGTSSHPDWIAFIRAGNIWVMRPDGSEDRALTHAGGCSAPAVSPDSQRVAYVGQQGEESDIYLVDLQGGPPQRLSQDLDVYQPGWSPQGKHLTYLRLPASEEQSEGSVELLHPVVLRNLQEPLRFDAFESRTGLQFLSEEKVFLAQTDENETIQALWRMNLEATEGDHMDLPQEEFDPYFCQPAISPDGKQLAYVSLSDRGEGHLVQDLSGNVLARWGPYPPLGSDVPFPPPLWSPDGRWVLFEHSNLSAEETAGLWVTEVETGQNRRLYATTSNWDAEARIGLTGYSWAPQGSRLAVGVVEASGFGEKAQENLFVAVVDVATGEVTRLAEGAAEPSWGGPM